MAEVTAVKKFLADKYGKKEEDLEDSTKLSSITTKTSEAAGYLKDEYGTELSTSDLEDATIETLADKL